ncbi:methyltransferase [Aurantimonas sp. VKM B-3413]|uniref:class I SAM-dependent methyltransferase n=1 Tax=Aurantimonas sp. VKM B-3413 TaxID=2779401 RepID=UPI001E523B53|nr:50S ribosomal protein L11 methyltransferase [Aurantimonas sp. VKM B-3413]MCB8838485.1 50S ribosomal protein L11 methyltransferase [Aurantimonas sp. VKM B-3413]
MIDHVEIWAETSGDTGLPSQVIQFIETRFPVEPVPSVSEIVLHSAGPGSGLWRLARMDDTFASPYWAYLWGGGLALARHVLDHPETVAGRSVLDLGSGSGIVGIAAAKSGARQVIAADTDRYAVAATALNAAANEVVLATVCGDLTAGAPPDVDVVLVGDLFYEADLAARVAAFLDRCVSAGIAVLVGDPRRDFLPHSRLRLLAEYPAMDFAGPAGSRPNAVFSYVG